MPVNNDKPAKIVFFSHNRKDTAFRRRIAMLQMAGAEVSSFTFRRDGEPETPGPDWQNVDLGHVEHAQFFKRLLNFLTALRRIFANRSIIGNADVVDARNLDVFLLAWFACLVAPTSPDKPRAKLVYECLDVHESLTKASPQAALLRWLERKVLKRSDLLIFSSPGFIDNYFTPRQNYSGPGYWVENKLHFGDTSVERPDSTASERGPLVIAWVGIIRCQETLSLLKAAAEAMPDDVIIRISGLVSYFLIPDFDEQIEGLGNMVFAGPYEWPEGLHGSYTGAHLVWSQELSWGGHNSDWLIPNRVYEASYFGIPSVAVASTQTGQFIEQRRIGYTLKDAEEHTFIEFLRSLDRLELMEKQSSLLARSSNEFVSDDADASKLLDAMLMESQPAIVAPS